MRACVCMCWVGWVRGGEVDAGELELSRRDLRIKVGRVEVWEGKGRGGMCVGRWMRGWGGWTCRGAACDQCEAAGRVGSTWSPLLQHSRPSHHNLPHSV